MCEEWALLPHIIRASSNAAGETNGAVCSSQQEFCSPMHYAHCLLVSTQHCGAALIAACEKHDAPGDVIETLLKNGADVNHIGQSTFMLGRNAALTLKMIWPLGHGKGSPLYVACQHGSVDCIKILLEHRADTTMRRSSPSCSHTLRMSHWTLIL